MHFKQQLALLALYLSLVHAAPALKPVVLSAPNGANHDVHGAKRSIMVPVTEEPDLVYTTNTGTYNQNVGVGKRLAKRDEPDIVYETNTGTYNQNTGLEERSVKRQEPDLVYETNSGTYSQNKGVVEERSLKREEPDVVYVTNTGTYSQNTGAEKRSPMLPQGSIKNGYGGAKSNPVKRTPDGGYLNNANNPGDKKARRHEDLERRIKYSDNW